MKTTPKSGTREWSGTSENIQRGCEHDCRYCYAKYDCVRRFGRCSAEEWTVPVIDQKKVDKSRGLYDEQPVMFPTTHDITPKNISEYCCVLRKLLDAGNQVLLVTKPHGECVELICEAYAEYQSQMTWRFTIGSMDDDVLGFWEPGAPKIKERLYCLEFAFHKGFRTSISCEPFLDKKVEDIYLETRTHINDSFWIGKLRNFQTRVNLQNVSDEDFEKYVIQLLEADKDSNIRAIYDALKGRPFIKWKDSIRDIIPEANND
jgi:DNA repair photolyase